MTLFIGFTSFCYAALRAKSFLTPNIAYSAEILNVDGAPRLRIERGSTSIVDYTSAERTL